MLQSAKNGSYEILRNKLEAEVVTNIVGLIIKPSNDGEEGHPKNFLKILCNCAPVMHEKRLRDTKFHVEGL